MADLLDTWSLDREIVLVAIEQALRGRVLGEVAADELHARIARITTAVATMQGVDARLDWPADAEAGDLVIRAQEIDAPDLGYHYRSIDWSCRLQRAADNGWACAGWANP